MKVNIVTQLVNETQAVAQQMLDMRTLMPHFNVSRMMAQHPELIFKLQPDKVSQQLLLLREELAGKDIDDLLQREPLMLTANLKYALQELTRMLPDKDPAEFLFKHPGMVLTMDEQMLGSSIDGDLTKS
ncbi:hypothetical protein ABBQ38_001573 [Trebouxia sp. C0009 RCD-2024]